MTGRPHRGTLFPAGGKAPLDVGEEPVREDRFILPKLGTPWHRGEVFRRSPDRSSEAHIT